MNTGNCSMSSLTVASLLKLGLQDDRRPSTQHFFLVDFFEFDRWVCPHPCQYSTFYTEKIRPSARGLRIMRVNTIGRGRGGHPCEPNPYSSWLSSIKSLKLVKLLQVKKSDSGDCINNASVTPRNTEYAKYNPPGAQVSNDGLTQKYLLSTPPSWQKRKIWVRKAGIHGRIFSVPSRSGGLDRLVLPLRFRMVIIDVIEDVANQSTVLSTVGHLSHEVW